MSNQQSTRRTVLKTTATLAVGAAGVGAFTGSAAAHFPDDLSIDVKPGSDQNTINPNSNGITKVAVLQTDDFDPTSADVRYRFGPHDVFAAGEGATQVSSKVKDVNGDGRDDLVLCFRTDEADFAGDEDEAEVRWDRDDSREHGLSGRDAVRFVGN
ncbi:MULTISPECIES: hypothetical protein [unclassified Haladaptatus]|uniref:hypothetical protein n=1 Tax=unclassified Haladaptatus TaxID=2622732 RepID=UPI0023E840C2|nr:MULTISPECIES: hypothetical protein [unclassified Haladaptatus]